MVGEGEAIVAEVAAGSRSAGNCDAPSSRVGTDTLYDIASLTKPMATTACTMALVSSGTLDLDAPARRWLPELRAPGAEGITLRRLLGHASGLPAHEAFYRRLWAGERLGADSRREALLRMVGEVPLEAEAGSRVTYSDLGFMLLGFALERASGERLDALARRLVFEPIGLDRTRFVDLEALDRPVPVAPTELCSVRGLVRGEVHDENAHASGGICGHAGLFSTAKDVAAFARAVCRAASGDRGPPFDPDTVRRFFREGAGPGSTWRLGWDRPASEPGVSAAGDRWPACGVGHLGFTGTSLWMDPQAGRYVVTLTNRVHPTRHREGIRSLRRELMDTVAKAFGYPPRDGASTGAEAPA